MNEWDEIKLARQFSISMMLNNCLWLSKDGLRVRKKPCEWLIVQDVPYKNIVIVLQVVPI